ncbi:hypothetical protein [Desertivirga xinjiangensis]|uniref:hypothetical protein n=1 Tax=Desertivirga xinjiangensis TaxID=539206 RepID=UPI00210BB4D6|nr:hypothetical protein [Pedobacter xinjiangensis]
MRLSLFLLVFFLLSCGPSKRGAEPGDSTGNLISVGLDAPGTESIITCWGVGRIDLGDDLDAIIEKFGPERVTQDSLYQEGMFQGLITVVGKGTPEEVIVRWEENKPPFKNIRFIEIEKVDSPYQFANGIKIGTSMAEIVKLNGGNAVRFYGFGWDYAGTFANFDGGKLEGDIPCFGGVFAPGDQASSELPAGLNGDKKLSSDHPDLKGLNLKLVKIRIMNK